MVSSRGDKEKFARRTFSSWAHIFGGERRLKMGAHEIRKVVSHGALPGAGSLAVRRGKRQPTWKKKRRLAREVKRKLAGQGKKEQQALESGAHLMPKPPRAKSC